MSRYFKYKSSEGLLADARALGLDLALSEDLSPLLPADRGRRARVGNRLAIQPMEGCDGEPDGSPGELTFRRYRRFGAGGAKLIWGEAAAVVPEGPGQSPPAPHQRPTTAPGPRADASRDCRQAHREAIGDGRRPARRPPAHPLGPLLFRRPDPGPARPAARPPDDRRQGHRPTASADTPLISDDELDRLQDRYVEAAALAFRIGFDFVDIKQCHRYLLNELLAARTRPGKYGGPLENRTRFIREVIGRIRSEHPGRIIATR